MPDQVYILTMTTYRFLSRPDSPVSSRRANAPQVYIGSKDSGFESRDGASHLAQR